MFFVRARRVGVVLLCGVLAVAGVAVPVAQAQVQDPVPPPYTVRTEPADLSTVYNGDRLIIRVSGLPAGATVQTSVCPGELPDRLVKVANGTPDHLKTSRVSAYCRELGDELTGRSAAMSMPVPRSRSALTGDVVIDTFVPRGTTTPTFVNTDPLYTSFLKKTFKWADNEPVTDPETGQTTRRQYSYKCDENNPCTVALKIVAKDPAGKTVTWIDNSIKFVPLAPSLTVQGCQGIGEGTLSASVPERFGRTMVGWNQALCAPTKAHQPANPVNETEDVGLVAFDKATSDVAITGSGGALATQAVRSREYIPVGLNAVVVAAAGWAPTDRDDNNAPLTARWNGSFAFGFDELANMLTKGGERPDGDGRGGIFKDGSALVGRNPAMAAMKGTDGASAAIPRSGALDAAITGFFGVTGLSGNGTMPLALSQVLAKSAPSAWVFPKMANEDYFGELNGKSPGVITDLGKLDPGKFRLSNVDAKSDGLAVRKTVDSAMVGTGSNCRFGCLNWVITDLATAKANNWAPVAMPDGDGNFVAPTEQSLQAAAALMKVGDDGTPQTGTVTGKGAYPLTFVEHLTVPVNPLIDATCKPMKEKQAQLKAFTELSIGYGQALLAPGLVRLTPSLAATAAERAGKIGTGTVEEACKEKEEAKDPPPAGSNGTGTTPVSNPSLNSPGSSGASASTPSATSGPAAEVAPTLQSVAAAKNLAESVDIPTFAGAGVLGALIPLLALVILATLPSTTAYVAAGRPIPRWLTIALAEIGAAFAMLFALLRRGPAGGAA